MKFNSVFNVLKEKSQDDFLRAVLIKLGVSKDAPTDACDIKFDKVEESTVEVIYCKAYVDMDYSASVGYDRQEEYWDKEKKTEYVNGVSHEYLVDVKKTRTVTDWSPYNGHTEGEAIGLAFNSDDGTENEYLDAKELADLITTIDQKNVVNGGESEVHEEGLKNAKNVCVHVIERSIEHIGDHFKDLRTKPKVDVIKIDCLKLPYYFVCFTYKGISYSAEGYACGKFNANNLKVTIPPNNVDINKLLSVYFKPYKKRMIGSWIAFGVAFAVVSLLNTILGNIFPQISLYIGLTWLIVPIFLAIAIVNTVKGIKFRNQKAKSLKDDNEKTKLNNLAKALKSLGYKEATDEEKEALIN